jgi:adenylosuccinate lyase
MQQDIPLEQALSADPLVTAHLSAGEIRAHLAPERYLGSARHFIDAVLKATQGARP